MSQSTWIKGLFASMIAAGLMLSAGCQSGGSGRTSDASLTPTHGRAPSPSAYRGDTAAAPADHGAMVQPAVAAQQPAPVAVGSNRSVAAFPTGDRATSVLLVERTAPQQVIAGQPFDYDIKVTNLTNIPAVNVVITDQCASNFKLASSEPTAKKDGQTMTWALGTLDARQSKTIKVKGQADGPGTLTHCIAATFDQTQCLAIEVVQPALDLVKTMPAEALLCNPVSVSYTVTNKGTGNATNVVINDTVPAGLVAEDGQTAISRPVGTLAAGQSKTVTINLKALKPGEYGGQATAQADAGLKAQSSAKTVVREPVLAVAMKCVGKTFMGESFTNEITVTNNGDAAAESTVLELVMSGGSASAVSEGGKLEGAKAVWSLGSLAPKASKTVSYTVNNAAIGTVATSASVRAVCAKSASANCETLVQGIPAILLEVVDVTDPVRVGGQTTYIITATNQGSADGTNIVISAGLEDASEFVKAEGATKTTATGKSVSFAALPVLKPREKATWSVTVKAVKAADARFKVSMKSDQLSRPVEETEATNLYQ